MEEQKNNQKFIRHNILKWVISGLIAIIILILVFGLGILIGEKKAKFSYLWAEQYHKMFAGPRPGFFGNWRSFPREEFIESHGNFGEIIEIKENEFVIKGKNNVEKVILINEKTIIQKGREKLKKEDLKTEDFVVIIGSPNEEGKIEAKFIRIFNGEIKKLPIPLKSQKFPFL